MVAEIGAARASTRSKCVITTFESFLAYSLCHRQRHHLRFERFVHVQRGASDKFWKTWIERNVVSLFQSDLIVFLRLHLSQKRLPLPANIRHRHLKSFLGAKQFVHGEKNDSRRYLPYEKICLSPAIRHSPSVISVVLTNRRPPRIIARSSRNRSSPPRSHRLLLLLPLLLLLVAVGGVSRFCLARR